MLVLLNRSLAGQIAMENLLSARRRSSGGGGRGHGGHERLLSAPSLVGAGSEAGMMMVNASEAVARAKEEGRQDRKRNRRRSSIQQVTH